ncbi:MAG: ATP-binding protein [Ginsengibacter sp.]
MLKFNDISLRNKLILMQVFTSVVVFGIVFGVFIITDVNSYKKRKVESMISLAQVLGTNSISSIEFQDPEAARVMLEELQTVSPEIVHAEITNKEGQVFASYSKAHEEKFSISPILHGKSYSFTNEQLFVSNPIVSNNQVIGKVYLEIQLTELQEIKQYKYELAFMLLLVALVFSFLIAIMVQGYLSTRLLKLVNAVKKIRKTGEITKAVEDKGKDEIATLIQAFNNMMEEIQENQKKKDEFIGIASHELKTPLTSIKGYVEMLNILEHENPKKQYAQKALENINKLERLVKDLLDVSKIQSGQLQLEMKEFNMDELLNETVNASQMVSETHKIVRRGGPVNEMIYGDRQKIEQVLLNLLSNSIKYSPTEKIVYVDTEKTEKELIIKIRDYGIGVAPEEQTNIFERFYRSNSLAIHISGFGLGLYICRDIINRHSGRIWVESAGKGSIFNFSLPLKHSTIQQTQV